jgi:hypothetical protein
MKKFLSMIVVILVVGMLYAYGGKEDTIEIDQAFIYKFHIFQTLVDAKMYIDFC